MNPTWTVRCRKFKMCLECFPLVKNCFHYRIMNFKWPPLNNSYQVDWQQKSLLKGDCLLTQCWKEKTSANTLNLKEKSFGIKSHSKSIINRIWLASGTYLPRFLWKNRVDLAPRTLLLHFLFMQADALFYVYLRLYLPNSMTWLKLHY